MSCLELNTKFIILISLYPEFYDNLFNFWESKWTIFFSMKILTSCTFGQTVSPLSIFKHCAIATRSRSRILLDYWPQLADKFYRYTTNICMSWKTIQFRGSFRVFIWDQTKVVVISRSYQTQGRHNGGRVAAEKISKFDRRNKASWISVLVKPLKKL